MAEWQEVKFNKEAVTEERKRLINHPVPTLLPCGLAHASPRHHKQLVPQVRVAVVEANAAGPRHDTLHYGAKRELGGGSKAGKRACKGRGEGELKLCPLSS